MKIFTVSRLLVFCSLIFILIATIGCRSIYPPDNSLLQQASVSCKFPCWRGLTIGHSTLADIQEVINTDTFISSRNGVRRSDEPNTIIFWWWHRAAGNQNRLILQNNVLERIDIVPNTNFSLDQILKLYKEPVGFYIRVDDNYGTSIVRLFLFYPKIGLTIHLQTEMPTLKEGLKGSFDMQWYPAGFTVTAPQDALDKFVSELEYVKGQPIIMNDVVRGWLGQNTDFYVNFGKGRSDYSVVIATQTPIR